MARWECIVCGLIYDEKEGWPDDGIPAGTKWSDVPDDWLCPDCGVGKDDFELIPGSEGEAVDAAASENEEAEHTQTNSTRHIVIVGSGLAGYGLVSGLRKLDAEVPITLVTRDGGESYSKPMISTGYTKNLSAQKLAAQTPEAMAEQLGITLLTRKTVDRIDPQGKVLHMEGGDTLVYSELVLTLGAELIRPPMGGNAADEVMGVNDLDDYRRFRDTLEGKGRA